MQNESFQSRTRFVIQLGKALHECGATSQSIERHLMAVSNMLGVNASFLVSPTTFTSVFWLDDEFDQHIHVERTEPTDTNLGRLWEIDQLVSKIETGQVSFEDGPQALEQLIRKPAAYSMTMNALSWILIGGCFASLVSANAIDSISAAGLSLLTFLVAIAGTSNARVGPLVPILAPMLSALCASALQWLGVPLNVPFVILSSIVVFIPGLALTVALSEIASRNLISGSSRLVDAIMLLFKLFFGAAMGVSIAALLWPHMPVHAFVDGQLPDWTELPAVLVLAWSLAIAFNIPQRRTLWGVVSALIAFWAAQYATTWLGATGGMFVGALAVGLYSNLFARLTQSPASIMLTQGIVLLVPGSKTYMIINSWVSGQDILPGTMVASNQAIMIFIALIAGLTFAHALLPSNKSL
jgi:uncharacterized membrane protein YjjP (DUF1212 family)